MFTQNDYDPAAADSQIGLVPGERMSVHDLLLALMLPSADDAAEDLAYNVGGGSIPRFVAMMNAEAAHLGLTHTHYSTPIGLDTPGNYSTAFDLDHLAAYALAQSPLLRRIVDLPSATLTTGPVRYVVNRNDLVGRIPWINGVKTGHTADAGYVLVASGTQDGMTLIGAVLGTESEAARDANALALLNYGFAEFTLIHPVHTGQVITRRPIAGVPYGRATLVAAGSFVRVIPRADHASLSVVVSRRLRGPLATGTKVGHVAVMIDAQPVATIPLVLGGAIAAPPPAESLLTRLRWPLIGILAIFAGWGLRRARVVRLTKRRGLEA